MSKTPEIIFYPTYNPPYSPYNVDTGALANNETNHADSKRSIDHEYGRHSNVNTSTVRRPWWMLSFEKRLSLVLFLLCGGAAIGFSIAGLEKMSFQRLIATTIPVEGYWYHKSPWKICIMLHIITTIPATFFSVFCFLPISFKMWPRLHGVVGYIVSALLVLSCAGGAVVARRAQGGELGVQLGYYMLASGAAFSVVMGCIEGWRHAFDAHREWMLRAWIYNGALITTHATTLVAARVIAVLNSYYTPMRCSEVNYLLSSDIVAQQYPQCSTPEAIASPDNFYIVAKAAWDRGNVGESSAIRATFGMSMLLAIIFHCIGVEIYLRATRDESKWLQELSERKRLRAIEGSTQP
ncbi:hypothetical protein B0J17DRAFT_722230 [Rhizoctonia solani]|nr:hypothetical protein B0J17DRAFT_722230 [Rhizoctonia solani]